MTDTTAEQRSSDALARTTELIRARLESDGVVILPPMDIAVSQRLVARCGMKFTCTMLDPWYNKGVGGVRADYVDFIVKCLEDSGSISQHVYLWGFPEIVARFIERIPQNLSFVAWLTWYYKNNPSVIRGWRSAQMACLHLTGPEAKLHPEHFLNEAQLEKQRQGKLRYMPGPPSVIEDSLLVGFVGRKEQTGHPAQKPFGVYERLILMATVEGESLFDPMAGSGTTGAVAQALNRSAVLCDESEEYTQLMEARLGVRRLKLPDLGFESASCRDHAAAGA